MEDIETAVSMGNAGHADHNGQMNHMDHMMHEMPPVVIAMAYVPYQKWEKLYDLDVGFERGTLFPQLDKPFIGEGVPSHGK